MSNEVVVAADSRSKVMHLQRGSIETDRLIQVLQQPPRRANQDVHAAYASFFFIDVFAADDQARTEAVEAADLPARDNERRVA